MAVKEEDLLNLSESLDELYRRMMIFMDHGDNRQEVLRSFLQTTEIAFKVIRDAIAEGEG